jgi:hypothetical protein
MLRAGNLNQLSMIWEFPEITSSGARICIAMNK